MASCWATEVAALRPRPADRASPRRRLVRGLQSASFIPALSPRARSGPAGPRRGGTPPRTPAGRPARPARWPQRRTPTHLPVQRPPPATPASWPQLPRQVRALYRAGMRVRQVRPQRRQLQIRVDQRRLLPRDQAAPLRLGLRQVADRPHCHRTISCLLSVTRARCATCCLRRLASSRRSRGRPQLMCLSKAGASAGRRADRLARRSNLPDL